MLIALDVAGPNSWIVSMQSPESPRRKRLAEILRTSRGEWVVVPARGRVLTREERAMLLSSADAAARRRRGPLVKALWAEPESRCGKRDEITFLESLIRLEDPRS